MPIVKGIEEIPKAKAVPPRPIPKAPAETILNTVDIQIQDSPIEDLKDWDWGFLDDDQILKLEERWIRRVARNIHRAGQANRILDILHKVMRHRGFAEKRALLYGEEGAEGEEEEEPARKRARSSLPEVPPAVAAAGLPKAPPAVAAPLVIVLDIVRTKDSRCFVGSWCCCSCLCWR